VDAGRFKKSMTMTSPDLRENQQLQVEELLIFVHNKG
jgi:hypothetical protein